MRRPLLLALVPIIIQVSAAAAGVPEVIHPTTGVPVKWTDPNAIPYWLDPGPLGRLSNTQARELLEAMAGVWEEVDGTAMHMQPTGMLAEDVTSVNVGNYIDGSVCASGLLPSVPSMKAGESPVVFDSDGSIIDLLAGEGASRKIVGRSGFRCYDGTLASPNSVTQAFVIMNGRFFDGESDPEDLSANTYAGIMLHELGHFLGLHHSMVNETVFNDLLYKARPASDSKFIPVMYPLVDPDTISGTVLKPDDRAAISAVYPSAGSSLGSLAGIVWSAERNGVRGANVVARRQDDPLCRAVSTISGRFCTPLVDSAGLPSVVGEWCKGSGPAMGGYRIDGLLPGDYTVEVSEITTSGGARQNMFPKSLGIDLPGPAEYYNSADALSEDPLKKTVISVAAGAQISKLDVFLAKSSGAAMQKSLTVTSYTGPEGSPCITDPVDYNQLIAMVADEEEADKTPGLSAPSSLGSGGGCALAPAGTGSPLIVFVTLLGALSLFLAKRSRVFKSVFPLSLLLFSYVASATTSLPVSPQELAQSADRIFYGECIEHQPGTDEHGLTVTEITYQVRQMLKGEQAPYVTFRVAGAVTDCPEAILFLYPDSKWGLTSPVGGEQGIFRVYESSGGEKTVRNPFAIPSAAGRGKSATSGTTIKNPPPISPEDLLDRISGYIQPQAP